MEINEKSGTQKGGRDEVVEEDAKRETEPRRRMNNFCSRVGKTPISSSLEIFRKVLLPTRSHALEFVDTSVEYF